MAFLTALLTVVAAELPQAQAQTCGVEVGERVELSTGGATVCVRMAADRYHDVPAVMWNDNLTGALVYRKHIGPADDHWDSLVTVDTGNVAVPTNVHDDYPRLWRMFALAFDPAGEPHVVFTGEMTAGDTKLYYVHRRESAGWSAPEELADLPDVLSGGSVTYEPWVEVHFDTTGRLHVAYHCYGGGAVDPACAGKINALYRDGGVWTGPHQVLNSAAGMDMAVGADDVVHVVTVRGGGNQHQAFYTSAAAGEGWPGGNGVQITNETPGYCYAGPVSCWPSIATDSDGHPYVAFGIDPDPCCVPPPEGPADCDWPHAPDPPEPQWIQDGGAIKVIKNLGSGWNSDSPDLALDDIALHGSLPQLSIDPLGLLYVVGPNWNRQVGVNALTDSFAALDYETTSGARWLFLDATATGQGAWVAYPWPPYGNPAGAVIVKHLARTGDCQTGPQCTPEQTRACGYCGTQACDQDSQWEACTAEGQCYPGTSMDCEGATVICSQGCEWDPPCDAGNGGSGGEGGSSVGGSGGNGASGSGFPPAMGAVDDEADCSCQLPGHSGPLAWPLAALAAWATLVRTRRSRRPVAGDRA